MRRCFLLVLLFLLSSCEYVPPNNFYYQNKIKKYQSTSGEYCSGFNLKYNEKLYYVTARHAVTEERNKNNWNLNYDDFYVMELSVSTEHYFEPSDIEIPIGLLEKEAPRVGFPVIICGYEESGKYIESNGFACGRIVCNINSYDILITTSEGYIGMSGGPLLDKNGKVLGVFVQALEPNKNENGMARSVCTPIHRVLMKLQN